MNRPSHPERRRRWISRSVVLLAALALGLTGSAGAQTYVITDLGTLGGLSSEASGVNKLGQVVGWSQTAAGQTHGFVYRDNATTDLGTLLGGTYSYATGINDLGQVVGFGGINAYGPQFQEFTQAFIWQDGSMQSLGALYCPCSFNQRYGTSAAFGINAAGQVVGDSGTVRGEWVRHAFLWQNGAMQDIGGGAGSWSISYAYGINALSQVVGAFDGRAFLWQDGGGQDLGTLPGGSSSRARGINATGQVVGESDLDGGLVTHAFLWKEGSMQDLGTLPGDLSSRARGINAAGQVVGESVAVDGVLSRAFLWQDGVMTDLNTLLSAGSGWLLTSAAAINEVGQIAGTGLHNGAIRAFLLTPVVPAAPGDAGTTGHLLQRLDS